MLEEHHGQRKSLRLLLKKYGTLLQKILQSLNSSKSIKVTRCQVRRFNPEVSYFPYSWTRAQEDLFNNQFARAVAQRPEYFSNCKDWTTGEWKWSLVGDAYGNKPTTFWRVVRKYITKNGGPYQWHHVYKRFGKS